MVFKNKVLQVVLSAGTLDSSLIQIRLRPHQYDKDILRPVLHHKGQPVRLDIIESALLVHIEQDDGAVAVSVLQRGHGAVSFLPCRVPNVQANLFHLAAGSRSFI